MQSATMSVNLQIDVSPNGIEFTIEGMEDDLADLIREAKDFEVLDVKYRSVETSDVFIRSVKALTFIDRGEEPSEEEIEESGTLEPEDNNTG